MVQRPSQGDISYIALQPGQYLDIVWNIFPLTYVHFDLWVIASETFNLIYSKACNFYLRYRVLHSNNHSKCYYIIVADIYEQEPTSGEFFNPLRTVRIFKICNWICKNRSKSNRNWNPFYCWTLKLNSCTNQKRLTHGHRWPSLLSQTAFCHPCQNIKVHYRVFGASEWH